MLTLQMIACIGMIVGAFLLLGIRINDFTGNIFRKLLNPGESGKRYWKRQSKRKSLIYAEK